MLITSYNYGMQHWNFLNQLTTGGFTLYCCLLLLVSAFLLGLACFGKLLVLLSYIIVFHSYNVALVLYEESSFHVHD